MIKGLITYYASEERFDVEGEADANSFKQLLPAVDGKLTQLAPLHEPSNFHQYSI